MGYENIDIGVDYLKTSAKQCFLQNYFDYDNSNSVNSDRELQLLLVGTGANDVEDILNSSFQDKKSKDKETIIDSFINNTDAAEKQRVLQNCYDKLSNAYEAIESQFNSILDSSNEISYQTKQLQNNGDITTLNWLRDRIKNMDEQFTEAYFKIKDKTDIDLKSFKKVMNDIDFLIYDIKLFVDSVKNLSKLEQYKKIKEYANNLNHTIERYIPTNLSFPNGMLQTTAMSSNCMDFLGIYEFFQKYKEEDLAKIENLKNNPTKIKEKDILDIFKTLNPIIWLIVVYTSDW